MDNRPTVASSDTKLVSLRNKVGIIQERADRMNKMLTVILGAEPSTGLDQKECPSNGTMDDLEMSIQRLTGSLINAEERLARI
jgi:hypothetical protein